MANSVVSITKRLEELERRTPPPTPGFVVLRAADALYFPPVGREIIVRQRAAETAAQFEQRLRAAVPRVISQAEWDDRLARIDDLY